MPIAVRGTALAAVLSMALAAGAAQQAAAQQSQYTRHDFSACPEAKSPEPGVVEVRRCAGLRGVAVTLTSEPDAAFVTFGNAPAPEPIGVGSFHQPGDTVEWREGAGGPVAAIIRYRVGDSVEKLDRSVLVVHRLEPSGKSCVMAIVHEPGANRKARAVADAEGPHFRCGSSARLSR